MLTRLKVTGFKNLVDVDVSFGPFTCIAGANGVGKSNLLDAIVFLSMLAEKPLLEAALSVRSQEARTGDIRGLFNHSGKHFAEEMSFVAEMIIPQEGEDDLGQTVIATSTFVRYKLRIGYKEEKSATAEGGLEIIAEELVHILAGDAEDHLPFPHSPAWRKQEAKNNRHAP